MNDDSSRGPNVWKDIGYPVVRDTLKLVLPWLIAAIIVFAAGWWALETFVWSPGRKVVEVVTSVTEATGEAVSNTYEAGKEAAGNAIEATKDFGADMLERAKDMLPSKGESAESEASADQAEATPDATETGCRHSFVPFWGCPPPEAGK